MSSEQLSTDESKDRSGSSSSSSVRLYKSTPSKELDGERVRANDPTLVKLYLTLAPTEYYAKGGGGGGCGLEEFSEALRHNTHISYVLMERNFVRALQPDEYAAVLEAVAQIPNLVELEIWSVRVPLATLCQAIANGSQQLFRLGLGMVTLTETTNLDCSALFHHPSLQYFYLSDFRFLEDEPDKNLDSLWEALSTCPHLFHVELFSNQFGEHCWTSSGLAHLASSQSIEQLTLRRLGLTGTDILPFADRLQSNQNNSNSHLSHLDLHQNLLGDVGCTAIASAVSTSRIRELDLRDNNLTSEGSLAVVPLLTSYRSSLLEKLNLAANPIGDEGARLFAEALEDSQSGAFSTLKHLDLSRSSITDVGSTRLAQALAVNQTLQSLGLSYNDMTNETYLAFGQVLKTQNRTLASLSLQCDRKLVELSGCQALLAAVEENYVLETVTTSLGTSRGYGEEKDKSTYSYYIRVFLRLNHAGRQRLFEGKGTKADWIQAIVAVQDSLHAIQYLVRSNPSLCKRD